MPESIPFAASSGDGFGEAELAALCARLTALGEQKYRLFHSSLIPGKQSASFGVRVPLVRGLGRELCRGDWRAFLDSPAVCADTHYEITMLRGLVTAGAKCSLSERMSRTAAFLPLIDNWAVNDTVCATYRIRPDERTVWREFLTPYLTCGREFEERFALILLMDQFLTDDSVSFVLDACAAARCPAYYTRMAVAWTLCTAFCKYRDETLCWLQGPKGQSLDAWSFNKAIQKCRESYRVTAADKELLNRMKRTAER